MTMSVDCVQWQHYQMCCSVGVELTTIIYIGSKLTLGSDSHNDLCNFFYHGLNTIANNT